MSQNDTDFSPSPMSGTNLLDTQLEGMLENVLTSNGGVSRPSYAQSGTVWIDKTNPALWVVKTFNGTDDIVNGTLDPTALTFEPSGGLKNVLTTKGDIVVGGTDGVQTRLGIGTVGQVPVVQSDSTLSYEDLNVTPPGVLTYYTTCSTASATAVKDLTIADLAGESSLPAGTRLVVSFANGNTSSTACSFSFAGTTIPSISINSLYSGSDVTSFTCSFVYNGTSFVTERSILISSWTVGSTEAAAFYNIYSDGWIEQGGFVAATGAGSLTVNFPVAFGDLLYHFSRQGRWVINTTTPVADAYSTGWIQGSKTVSSLNINTHSNAYVSGYQWSAFGWKRSA